MRRGDTVLVSCKCGPRCSWNGQIGVITADSDVVASVQLGNGRETSFMLKDLTLASNTIEDILT